MVVRLRLRVLFPRMRSVDNRLSYLVHGNTIHYFLKNSRTRALSFQGGTHSFTKDYPLLDFVIARSGRVYSTRQEVSAVRCRKKLRDNVDRVVGILHELEGREISKAGGNTQRIELCRYGIMKICRLDSLLVMWHPDLMPQTRFSHILKGN